MNKKIIITISIILIVLAAVATTLILVLYKDKKFLTAIEFKNKMEEKGYVLLDSDNLPTRYDNVNQIYIAKSDDYQIEFYEFINEIYAKNFYEHSENIFETSKVNGPRSQSKLTGKNYNKYTLTNDGRYKVASRINNTVILLNVDSKYKSTIKDILKELGY